MWLFICFLPLVFSRCYWSNKTPYQYFGTKTPYDVIRGDFRDVSSIPGCEPVSVWFMTRHGVRHPNAEDAALMKEASLLIDEILKMYTEGKGEMCAQSPRKVIDNMIQDISELRDWTWNDKLDNTTSKLTSEGFSELHAFGERFGEKFASLLKTLDKSQIRSTKEIRTLKSGDAFIQGLKRFKHPIKVAKPILNDVVARPYRYCKTRLEVIRSTKIISEVGKYQETREFQQMLANVLKLTGLSHLEARIVMGIYDLCRFYRAYTVLKRSPWCAVFTDEDLQILEYVEDIRHYFSNGYGHPMNLQLGAAGLKDLYEKFDKTIKHDLKILTGYFTHDTMIEMIYSAMGLHHDFPEISGFERDIDRKWRTSFLTPFTANFVAVLHRCTENVTHSYNVQFFVNEKEFHLCNARLCSWQDFKNKFEQFTVANLDFCDSTILEYMNN